MRPVGAKALIINAFALAGRFAIFNPYRECVKTQTMRAESSMTFIGGCQKSKQHAPKGAEAHSPGHRPG